VACIHEGEKHMPLETTPTLGQKLSAEAIGTFVLVFFGCGTALASGGDYVATALAFGLTVLTMAYAVGHISGGHFNPAVSLGAAISGRIAWKEAGIYAAVQVVAGLVAALLLLIVAQLYSIEDALASVSTQWDKGGSTDWLGGFVIEMIGTAVFIFIILAVTDSRREGTGVPAPVAIGLALALMHLAIIGFTGTSVNPARSIGPGLFAGWDVLQQQWLFILAPLTGAALGGFGYPAIFGYDRARNLPTSPVARPWTGGQPESSMSIDDGHTQIRPPDGTV
jgi:aquaporin Z